ncbi:hypothetical protein KBD75_03190 [Candidatus Woesebacteria bacterium]|nr:hypothetical protein [Candidatus Woesebacteria bacterium]
MKSAEHKCLAMKMVPTEKVGVVKTCNLVKARQFVAGKHGDDREGVELAQKYLDNLKAQGFVIDKTPSLSSEGFNFDPVSMGYYSCILGDLASICDAMPKPEA